MKSVAINGQLREKTGKGAARTLRSEGNTLGVIYGRNGEIHFYAPILSFRDIVYTAEFKLAEITVDDKTYTCILKDTQFDPVTDKLIHADFLELNDDQRVIADIPLRLTGRAKGVQAGGRLEQKMKTLRIRTYPKFLQDVIEVDVTNLKLNHNLRVEDVINENYEFMNSPRQPIASVVTTRALRQAEGSGTAEEDESEESGEDTDTEA